jgi:glutathione S-transferase
MSLTIYGTAPSRAFRVLWAAEELGLAYELKPYHFTGPEIKEPAFLAINPNGTIPAISDNGFPLFESLAITMYLAQKAGKLWPAALPNQARTYQWTLWAATEIEPSIGVWAYNTIVLPEAERKPELVADAAAKLKSRLAVLDGVLQDRDYLLGKDFTIADLNVAAALFRAPQFGLDAYPRVKAWHQRCYSRAGAKAAVAMREQKAA